jgi:hypothetical protein
MKKAYYIDYPQEHVEGQAHTYQCVYCKVLTTRVNGSLEGHLPWCEYRLKLEREGFERNEASNYLTRTCSDEVD